MGQGRRKKKKSKPQTNLEQKGQNGDNHDTTNERMGVPQAVAVQGKDNAEPEGAVQSSEERRSGISGPENAGLNSAASYSSVVSQADKNVDSEWPSLQHRTITSKRTTLRSSTGSEDSEIETKRTEYMKGQDVLHHHKALDQNRLKLIDVMDPLPLLDRMMEIDFDIRCRLRDIQEADTTSSKNRQIIDLVRSKGPDEFLKFLDILEETSNTTAYELLTGKKPTNKCETNTSANFQTMGARPKSSYASITNTIVAEKVNIHYNFNSQQTCEETSIKEKKITGDFEKFMKITKDFKSGHFILVVGKVKHMKNLNVLGNVPWTAVLDFDQDSRRDGLLSFVEDKLERKRSLHINTWQDKCSFTDTNTCWLLMKGSTDRLDTLVETDFKTWKEKIKGDLKYLMKQLEQFKQGSTEYTVIVIWPDDKELSRYLNFILSKIEHCLSPEVLLVHEGSDLSIPSSDMFDNIIFLKLTLSEVCHAIGTKFEQENESKLVKFKLPTSDGTNYPDIEEKEAQALKEELEVLYLEDTTGVNYSGTELQEEEENFFRGGTLPWAWWYHMGSGHADAERDIKERIIKYIKDIHIQECKSGCVTLFHFPGSGGTTLAQSILWDLRKDIPCVQVKHRNDQSLSGLAEKVQFLSEKTRLPILILMDGEEESKMEHIRQILQCCSIILYVKRCLTKPKQSFGGFWLKSFVSKKESNHVGKKYLDQCKLLNKGEKQKKAVINLMAEIAREEEHSIFEFGLAVHSYEYKGIRSYVEGFLQLKETKNLTLHLWQKALVMLSLAYYYGQTSVPCHFFSTMIPPKSDTKVLTFEGFPEEMKEFIVRDPHERSYNVVRISHYYVAKEILDQVLLWQQGVKDDLARETSPCISYKAKNHLESFVVDFVKNAGIVNNNIASESILKVLIRTIILRDNTAVGENETQVKLKAKRPVFSPIIEDLSSCPPYEERFSVLETLTRAFPSEPQFYAHLGRLYTICRPEKEKKAEECFQKALEICNNETQGMDDDEISLKMKLTLMHVFHMFGNMFSSRVGKYTGKNIQDSPKLHVDASNFEEVSKILLQNTRFSCYYFNKCRDITPPGWIFSYGYIAEINVRLRFCDFINRHKCRDKSKSILDFVGQDTSEIRDFVDECFITLDELFIDCFSTIDPEKMDPGVWNCQEWFVHLFRTRAPGHHLVSRGTEGLQTSRRKIVMLKMTYSDPKTLGVLDLITKAEDINKIVKEYENIFSIIEQDDQKHQISKRQVDIDYREWLFAIRHPKFPVTYTIERVLMRVQKWFDIVRTQNARFYLFVLKTLLGFGNNENDGNTELLIEAQRLKAELVQYSRYMTKPKYPREWLGPNGMGIHRITPGKRFFGQIEENQNIFSTADLKLEIMKGTICPPNDKPAVGYIALDLGSANRVAAKIFYVPARSDMKGEMNNGARVEFVIGFSMSHGYEAFNVQKLGRVNCRSCKKLVEFRSCDNNISCTVCNNFIEIKRNSNSNKECKTSPAK